MGYLEDTEILLREAKDLLKNRHATFRDFLRMLCQLERQYGVVVSKLQISSGKNIIDVSKEKIVEEIAQVANEIIGRITSRVKGLTDRVENLSNIVKGLTDTIKKLAQK
jgi:hypothetical protein